MDLTTKFCDSSLMLLPMWDYATLIHHLSTSYCVCLGDHLIAQTQACQVPFVEQCKVNFIKHKEANGSRKSLQKKTKRLRKRENNQKESVELVNEVAQPRMNQNEDRIGVNKEIAKLEDEIIKRESRSSKLNINPRLIQFRKYLLRYKVPGLTKRIKNTKQITDKYLGRRSKYIGVSKNNIHWQALINVNRAKKYIGTFCDEIEAARAYDLHAIAMQGKKAKLNFDYTPKEILSVIDHYLNLHKPSPNPPNLPSNPLSYSSPCTKSA
ncbi:unnamed protein product [Moneuplotes crassus]|uniref:AP2/ERF domain-containing protein n=1 Tax=Euplotes crassus TaxID=5936 RepID=A0AAD1XC73_EUPCR|nr:unnamed protein product [Moneuplotes crassus]